MSYEKDGIKYPRCTEIISDSTNKSNGLVRWSANEAVKWIRDNCEYKSQSTTSRPQEYHATDADLEQARYAYKDTSKIALDVGSEVHAAIEGYLKGTGHGLTSHQATNAFSAFLDWEQEVDLIPIALEQTVWGDRWAGTLDFFGYYKGKLYVVDWKTSKAFYPEMRYQVAAYRSAMIPMVEKQASENSYDMTDTSNLYDLEIERLTPKGCGVLMLDKTTGMPKFKDTSKTYEQDLKVFEAMVEIFYLRHPKIRKRFEGGMK